MVDYLRFEPTSELLHQNQENNQSYLVWPEIKFFKFDPNRDLNRRLIRSKTTELTTQKIDEDGCTWELIIGNRRAIKMELKNKAKIWLRSELDSVCLGVLLFCNVGLQKEEVSLPFYSVLAVLTVSSDSTSVTVYWLMNLGPHATIGVLESWPGTIELYLF